jgi:hypothetical protein
VDRINGHGDIFRAEQRLHRYKHLLCQPFLHLWSLREESD